MDQQNFNIQDRESLRTDESVISGESEKLKKFFRALAILVVFFSSLSVPLYLSYKAQEKAKEMRIIMDMGQLKNWAMVYSIKNGDYADFENSSEIKRVFDDIKSMDGDANIIVSSDSQRYCSQVNFINKKLGTWCVDFSGYVGKDGVCSQNNISCE
jgi:hypothetical protein